MCIHHLPFDNIYENIMLLVDYGRFIQLKAAMFEQQDLFM